MAEKAPTLATRSSAATAPEDGHRREIKNAILLALPRRERALVLSKAQVAELPARMVLTEPAQPIEFGYFLENGVVSIINVLSDGKSVEVGLTGSEGFVGLPLVAGYATSATRAVVQIAASARKICAADLKNILPKCPALEEKLQRYSNELSVQAVQIAACNRVHEVDERLARWLLMSQDRMGTSSFPLTQEFISHMLGTRRASVTVAAGILQKAGLITYRRGEVTIEDRGGLEDAACECYKGITEQVERWRNEAK